MRHGAAIIGLDYVQWEGNFVLAENFYTKLIPEVKEITESAKRKTRAAFAVEEILTAILNSDMHKWYADKINAEEKLLPINSVNDIPTRYLYNAPHTHRSFFSARYRS